MARLASEHGDDGTNDLLVSDVIRTNELQVWFVAEHVSIRRWSEQTNRRRPGRRASDEGRASRDTDRRTEADPCLL